MFIDVEKYSFQLCTAEYLSVVYFSSNFSSINICHTRKIFTQVGFAISEENKIHKAIKGSIVIVNTKPG